MHQFLLINKSLLVKLYKKDQNEIAFVALLMKILRKDEAKLEYAISSLSLILSNILKEKKWPQKYQDYYIQILE